MALSTQTAAALVAAAAPREAPAPVAVRVLRALCVQGQAIAPGDVIEVTAGFAAELASAGKAERVAAKPAPAPTPKPAAKTAAARTEKE